MLTVHPETVPAMIVAIAAGVIEGVGEGEDEKVLLQGVELSVVVIIGGGDGGPHEPLGQYTLRRRLDPISGSQISVLSVEVIDHG